MMIGGIVMEGDLKRDQVCRILNCSKKKFYELLHAKDPLPAYKLGDGKRAEWRIDADELRKWKERRKNAPEEIIVRDKPGPKPKPAKRWQMIPTVKKYVKAAQA